MILRLVADSAGYTNAALRRTPREGPITARIAICLAIRHEDVARVFARLDSMIESLEATSWAHRFAFHLLSDSSQPEIAAAEERAFAALKLAIPAPVSSTTGAGRRIPASRQEISASSPSGPTATTTI